MHTHLKARTGRRVSLAGVAAILVVLAAVLVGVPRQASAATIRWVNDDDPNGGGYAAPGTNCSDPGYATIQAAIDASVNGDTINVCAGTYNEQVAIDLDVTIDGADVAVLRPEDGSPGVVEDAWDVEFVAGAGGATLQNMVLDFNGAANTRDGRGITVSDLGGPAVTSVTISSNDITMGAGIGASTGGLEGVGIQTGKNADVSGLLISGNNFHGGGTPIADGATQGEEGIYVNPNGGAGSITISNNTFDGQLFTGISIEANNVTVTGNTVTRPSAVQNTNGIRVNDFVGGVNYGVTVSNNTVSGFAEGLRVGSGASAGSTLTVSATGNSLTGNTRGIWARHDANVTATSNSIAGNTAGAELLAGAAGPFNATCNWWGAVSGPSGAGPGSGDSVNAGVVFNPWRATSNLVESCPATGAFQFSQASYSVLENVLGGAITITVQRVGGSAGSAAVNYTTTAGSASTGVDYLVTSGTVWFANGETSKTFTVAIVNDGALEGTETLGLLLSNPTIGTTLGVPSTASVSILDDETNLPAVTSLVPNQGPTSGGTVVSITGANLLGVTTVVFGATPATTFSVFSNTLITAVSPAHAAGTVDVRLTSAAGTSANTAADNFTYGTVPAITSVVPPSGSPAGGSTLAVYGSGFTGATGVTVGGLSASFSVISDTQLLVTTPPGVSGATVDIRVTTPAGTSANTSADNFTYTGGPAITLVVPNTGSSAGGTTVTLTGVGFTGATSVTVGGKSASFTVNSDTKITLTTPSGTAGSTVDIRVTTPAGTSADTPADNFSYSGGTFSYTLYFRWNLIVWQGQNGINADTAVQGGSGLSNVSSIVTSILRWNAAQQKWETFFPGKANVPGANDFTTLENGRSYWVAVTSATGWTIGLP